jgi:hypothetical protein
LIRNSFPTREEVAGQRPSVLGVVDADVGRADGVLRHLDHLTRVLGQANVFLAKGTELPVDVQGFSIASRSSGSRSRSYSRRRSADGRTM